MRGGNISKEGWYKINKLLDGRKSKEIYNKDYMAKEIIEYYKNLYEDNPKRESLNHTQLKDTVSSILKIMIKNTNEKTDKIWPPNSNARDFNGISQKLIEKIIKGDNLLTELINYNSVLAIICQDEKNSNIFLHTISRSILFKKKESIRGGTDLRVINILPAWLVILEKLCAHKIKELLINKITMTQYGFIEGGNCNIAKIMIWYYAKKKGLNKHLLIDIKKAFDTINRGKLKNMLTEDFNGDNLNLLLSFINIYDSLTIDIIDNQIFPTKGGPQGSSIVPIFFIYYLDKTLKNIILKEGVKIQAYADDMVVQAKCIEDLEDAYFKIKDSIKNYDLSINPEKCEILSEDTKDKITDNDEGIDIESKLSVKYLGQKINSEGISEEIIDNKIFGKVKNKLNRLNYLTRLTRIRIFKIYMISKVNHLLPLITLNGHLTICWKYIRRIIYRDILQIQTSPLEGMVTLGLGYYNIIVKPILKMMEHEYIFFSNNSTLDFMKEAAKKSLIHWKIIEQKMPKEVESKIDEMINNINWYSSLELDKLIYNNMGNRLIRNSQDKEMIIKDTRCLKYPNYLYLLSNAASHEIIDTIIQKEKAKKDKNITKKENRITNLLARMFLCLIIGEKIIQDKTLVYSKDYLGDIEEEMTILELKLTQEIKDAITNSEGKINEVQEDIYMRIRCELRKNNITFGDLLVEGKLFEMQKNLRSILSKMSKEQARSIDLLYELIEESQIIPSIKNKVGRPKKDKGNTEKNQMKIDTMHFMDIEQK